MGTPNKGYFYIVMDSRAAYDVDRASVIDVFGAVSEKKAIKAFKQEWESSGAELVRYKEEDGVLTNPEIVYVGGA
jgi:regulator of RNase E activity RraB